MTRTEVYEKLNETFQEVFDDESIIVNGNTTARDIDGWDSLMNITLISEVQNSFNIIFLMNDITRMQNVGDMVDRIMELL